MIKALFEGKRRAWETSSQTTHVHHSEHMIEQPRDVEIRIFEQISVSFSARVEARDEHGNLIGISDSAQPSKKIEPKPSEVHYYLQEWGKGDDIHN
jgi:hypothetical protein